MSGAIDPVLVRGFTAAVVRCLRATVGLDAIVAVASEPHSVPRITVVLELAGEVRGPITWVFPPEIALELVRRLVDDPNPPPESVADGATELANILTGHASAALEAYGFRCELGIPTIHTGQLPAGVHVRMSTAAGPIDVVLSLEASRALVASRSA